MSKISLFAAACTALVLTSSAMLASTQASAATMTLAQDCAIQWKAMKAAGKVTTGMKWDDFLKTCKPTPAATTAPAAPAAAAPVVAKPMSLADDCAAQLKAGLASSKVKAGTKIEDFMKTCKPTPPAAPVPPAAAAKPVTPPAATAVKPVTPPADAGKAGKAAENSRIKQCGVEWKAMKAANKVPAGLTWPKFWSECDARLKAAGQ